MLTKAGRIIIARKILFKRQSVGNRQNDIGVVAARHSFPHPHLLSAPDPYIPLVIGSRGAGKNTPVPICSPDGRRKTYRGCPHTWRHCVDCQFSGVSPAAHLPRFPDVRSVLKFAVGHGEEHPMLFWRALLLGAGERRCFSVCRPQRCGCVCLAITGCGGHLSTATTSASGS